VRVSFSGLDGAGKTRQIDSLVAALEGEHTVQVLWVPFKIWPESLLNRLPASFRSRLGPRRRGTGSPTTAAPQAGRPARTGVLRRALWTVVATGASVSAGLSLRRRAAAATDDVLVLDRYRLDSTVKLRFWYPDVAGAWVSGIVRRLAPSPDVELFLRVDPGVAHRRKPEQWSVAQLTRQATYYDELTAPGAGVVVLDAERDPDVLAKEVLDLVRRVLRDR
jgi:thymidylate kinase